MPGYHEWLSGGKRIRTEERRMETLQYLVKALNRTSPIEVLSPLTLNTDTVRMQLFTGETEYITFPELVERYNELLDLARQTIRDIAIFEDVIRTLECSRDRYREAYQSVCADICSWNSAYEEEIERVFPTEVLDACLDPKDLDRYRDIETALFED